MQALTYYALYGAKNKFNNRLSDAEIESVTAKELVDKELKNKQRREKRYLLWSLYTCRAHG